MELKSGAETHVLPLFVGFLAAWTVNQASVQSGGLHVKCTCSRPIRKIVYDIARVEWGGVIPSKRDVFIGCSWYCKPGWSMGRCHDVQTESSFDVIFDLSNFSNGCLDGRGLRWWHDSVSVWCTVVLRTLLWVWFVVVTDDCGGKLHEWWSCVRLRDIFARVGFFFVSQKSCSRGFNNVLLFFDRVMIAATERPVVVPGCGCRGSGIYFHTWWFLVCLLRQDGDKCMTCQKTFWQRNDGGP